MNNNANVFNRYMVGCIAALALLSGCASTEEIMRADADPLEGYNRAMFTFNDTLDKAVVKPVAKGYRAITPDIINQGVSNFFSNLDDVVVIVNDLLQLKVEQAAMDTNRLVFNTTFGLAGFFDVATRMDLPKHEEDFAQTLGYWGIGEGYYLVLPFLGPSSTRDVWDIPATVYVHPLPYVEPKSYRYGLIGLRFVDLRADILRAEEAFAEAAAIDPYSFQRQAYLQYRRDLVYDGNPPKLEFDDLE